MELYAADVLSWEWDGEPFHAILTDPPYGLSFMQKEWDTFAQGRMKKYAKGGSIEKVNMPGTGFKQLPSHTAKPAPRCRTCGKQLWSGSPCECEEPDIPYDTSALHSYQEWTRAWAERLLQFVHPGALMFSYGGTRMFHRQACGFEDGGWELWDAMTRVWSYGTGFPKAQDIGKLIDKKAGAEREVVGESDSGLHRGSGTTVSYGVGNDRRATSVTAPATPKAEIWHQRKTPALKPAWEPILCARAPRGGMSYAELALKHGAGTLNVDAGRINPGSMVPGGGGSWGSSQGGHDGWKRPSHVEYQYPGPHAKGRYPANFVLSHTPDCVPMGTKKVKTDAHYSYNIPKNGGVYKLGLKDLEDQGTPPYEVVEAWKCSPECPARLLDEQSGHLHGAGNVRKSKMTKGTSMFGIGDFDHNPNYHKNTGGGASRFYYCAKASRDEREAGLEDFETTDAGVGALRDHGRGKVAKNLHPTIKPIDLNRWLASLLLPPPEIGERRLLVPFAGVGSEMIGAQIAGWDVVVGVEIDESYCDLAAARLKHWVDKPLVIKERSVNVVDALWR